MRLATVIGEMVQQRWMNVLLVLTLLLAVACTGNDGQVDVTESSSSTVSSTQTPTTRPASSSSSTSSSTSAPDSGPSSGSGEESPPVLVLASSCYGMCIWNLGPGGSELALYEDGTFITTDVTWERGLERIEITITLNRGRFDTEDLADIYEWAGDAGLVGGDSGSVGNLSRFADGGGRVFASRLGGVLQVVEAPHLYGESSIDHDALNEAERERRAALYELQVGVRRLADAQDTEPVPVMGYVVLAYHRTSLDTGVRARSIDVATFTRTPSYVRCAILPPDNEIAAQLATWSGAAPTRTANGRWSLAARPSYPHEHTCSEVDSYSVRN